MTDDDLLPSLPPPPGGLERLRARISADDRRRTWLVVPALAVAVALAVIWLRPRPPAAPLVAEPTALRDPSIENFYWVTPQPPSPPAQSPAYIDISAVTISP